MENKNLQDLLKNQQYSFKPYFSDRVMNQLGNAKLKAEDSFNHALDFLFPRIAFPSFAMLAIIFIVAAISNGSMDIDTLIGLKNYEEELLLQKF